MRCLQHNAYDLRCISVMLDIYTETFQVRLFFIHMIENLRVEIRKNEKKKKNILQNNKTQNITNSIRLIYGCSLWRRDYLYIWLRRHRNRCLRILCVESLLSRYAPPTHSFIHPPTHTHNTGCGMQCRRSYKQNILRNYSTR
jgi:hypothetical protein